MNKIRTAVERLLMPGTDMRRLSYPPPCPRMTGPPVGHVVIVQAAAAFLLLPMDAEHGRAQRIGEASGLENGKSLLAAHGHLGYHALTLFPGVGFLANHAKGECVESNGGAAARGLGMLGSINVSRAVRQRLANAPQCE